jgi:hypothetical protein
MRYLHLDYCENLLTRFVRHTCNISYCVTRTPSLSVQTASHSTTEIVTAERATLTRYFKFDQPNFRKWRLPRIDCLVINRYIGGLTSTEPVHLVLRAMSPPAWSCHWHICGTIFNIKRYEIWQSIESVRKCDFSKYFVTRAIFGLQVTWSRSVNFISCLER